jgi:hypothetical protein
MTRPPSIAAVVRPRRVRCRTDCGEPVETPVHRDECHAILPSSQVWLPITAFCTTLDNKNMAIKPNVLIAASLRLPVWRNNTIRPGIHPDMRMTFCANGIC